MEREHRKEVDEYESFQIPQQDKGQPEPVSWTAGLLNKLKTTLSTTSQVVAATPKSLPKSPAKPATVVERSNTSLKVIRELKGQGLNTKYWMKDDKCRECYDCKLHFNTFRRKHHCRICGQIFCRSCSTLTSADRFGATGEMRVCVFCLYLLNDYQADPLTHSPSSVDQFNPSSPIPSFRRQSNASLFMPSASSNISTPSTPSDFTSSTTPPMSPREGLKKMFSLPRKFGRKSMEDNSPFMIGHDNSNHNIPGEAITPTDLSEDEEEDDTESIIDKNSNVISSKLDLGKSGLGVSHQFNSVLDNANPFLGLSLDRKRGASVDYSKTPLFVEDDDEWIYGPDTTSPNLSKPTSRRVSIAEPPDSSKKKSLSPKLSKIPNFMKFSKDKGLRKRSATLSGLTIPPSALPPPPKSANLSNKTKSSQGTSSSFFPSFSAPVSPNLIQFGKKLKPTSSNPAVKEVPDSPSIQDTVELFTGENTSPTLSGSAVQENSGLISKPFNTELNASSIQHLQRFLHQVLTDAEIGNVDEWHAVLITLLLQVADNVSPDVRNAGDEIDIRHYIKIKKIPGASPQDSYYLKGVACSKSVNHKKMMGPLKNPRILLLSFAIDYTRVENQFISLEPLLSQEKEHVGNIFSMIMRFNPTLVLVGKRVSRLAFEMFLEHNVIVVHNIKPSVLEAIARCTQSEIVSSIDKLIFATSTRNDLKLGTCENFHVLTFINEFLLPDYRKSFLVFDGCLETLGCTLILRGSDKQTLGKIKRVLDLMIFVVYNLKLETFLFRDEFGQPPVTNQNGGIELYNPSKYVHVRKNPFVTTSLEECESTESERMKFFSRSILPYEHLILSASPFVKFPPPFLLQRLLRDETELEQANMKKLKKSSSNPPSSSITNPKELFDGSESIDGGMSGSFFPNLENYPLETRAGIRHLLAIDDTVSPFAHQNLMVLYSNICTEKSVPCQAPEIHVLEYYSDSDMTLGQYLEDLCFNSSYLCPAKQCDRPMLMHFRSYAHGQGRVNVSIEEFPSPLSGMEEKILMWSFCTICQIITPVVLMSDETWNYSFAKYLELTFYHTKLLCRAGICPHNIHSHHIRYFGLRNLAVRFEYDTIDLVEVSVPPLILHLSSDIKSKYKLMDIEETRYRITDYYDSINERINVIWNNFDTSLFLPNSKALECKSVLENMSRKVDMESKYLLSLLQQKSISSSSTDTLSINSVKWLLPEKIAFWDNEFQEFIRTFAAFDPSKELRKLVTASTRKIFETKEQQSAVVASVGIISGISNDVDKKFGGLFSNSEADKMSFPLLSSSPTPAAKLEVLHDNEEEEKTKNEKSFEIKLRSKKHSVSFALDSHQEEIFPMMDFPFSPNQCLGTTTIPNEDGSTVSMITDPFNDYLDSEFNEGELPLPSILNDSGKTSLLSHQLKYPSSVQYDSPLEQDLLLQLPKFDHYVNDFDSTTSLDTSFDLDASKSDVSQSDVGSKNISQRSESVIPPRTSYNDGKVEEGDHSINPAEWNAITGVTMGETQKFETEYEDDAEDDLNEGSSSNINTSNVTSAVNNAVSGEKSSIMKTITSLWSGNTVNFTPLVYPISPIEHIFADSLVIVREDEPSSIIAFTLSSKEYISKLHSMYEQIATAKSRSKLITTSMNSIDVGNDMELFTIVPQKESTSSPAPSNFSSANDIPGGSIRSVFAIPSDGKLDIEETLLRGAGTHIKYQFSDGPTKLFCKIFFAEQFDALRRNCKVEEIFIESLTRCSRWEAMGGKSGSTFLKTRDDRLVLKQLSRLEMDAFLKFAPIYFEYMSQALFHELPTVLAKIFGVYRIGFKNPSTGGSLKLDVLVMENLFYDREITRIFDLKGSMRNRHVQSTGKQNEVLLDENLVEFIYESPLFIREHSKRLLRASVWNDTLFLSKLNVMDYSLLVGIDETKHELVVGIVDFIRTFTWDKKLESWVKESGFFSSQLGNEDPTIVSPRIYKNRFREAMERYFLMVPDKFTSIKG